MIQKIGEWLYKYLLFFLPQGHPWDKIAHFLVSFGGFVALYAVFKITHVAEKFSLPLAALIILVLGIAKEISDIRLGKKDVAADLIADLIGIALALGMILFFSRIRK